MREKAILAIIILMAFTAKGQECKTYSDNGKLLKCKKYVDNKETEIWKYRFFNKKTVTIDLQNPVWKAEENSFHENGTCEKNEKVWIDSDHNVLSKFEQYYIGHDGEEKGYHGNLYNKFTLVNGIKTGIEDFYYANGQVKKTGAINKKGRQGEWKTYHVNGNLKSIENWVNFKREGDTSFYFENGNISTKGQNKNGKPYGEWYFYDHDVKEKLIKIGTFCKTTFEIIEWKLFDENNNLQVVKRFDKEASKWKHFDKKGNLIK